MILKGLNFSRDRELESEIRKLFESERVRGIIGGDFDNYIRASEIYELCPREEVIVALKNIVRKSVNSFRLSFSFFFGKEMHSSVQNVILKNLGGKYVFLGKWKCLKCGFVYGTDSEPAKYPGSCKCGSTDFDYVEMGFVDDDLWLRGEVDGFLEEDGKVLHIFEIKVVSNDFYKYLLSNFSLRYYWQIQTYLYLTKLDSCKVFLINRDADDDDSVIAVLTIARDEQVINAILDKARMIKNGIETGVYPLGVCSTINDKRAQSCPVARICFLIER